MRKGIILTVTLLLMLQVAVALDFNLRDSCQSDEEPLFSISNRTNANAGGVETFRDFNGKLGQDGKIVCASDTGPTTITDNCNNIQNPVLSFYQAESGEAHLSPITVRNEYVLCADNLATTVFRKCPGSSKPIVSIYDPFENHVAEPGYYEHQICGATFENATLAYDFTMSGDTSFFINEDETTGTDTTNNEPSRTSVENDSIMSGIVGNDNYPQTVEITNDNGRTETSLSEQGRTNLEWFLPLTTGTADDIRRRLDLIDAGDFLSQFGPSFAFKIAEQATLQVTLFLESVDLASNVTLDPGFHQLIIKNIGEEDGTTQVIINATTQQ